MPTPPFPANPAGGSSADVEGDGRVEGGALSGPLLRELIETKWGKTYDLSFVRCVRCPPQSTPPFLPSPPLFPRPPPSPSRAALARFVRPPHCPHDHTLPPNGPSALR